MIVSGRGRRLIPESHRPTGVFSGCRKDLHMRYQLVWCRVRESEKRFGQALVVCYGRGLRLTTKAQGLVTP